VHYHQTAIEEVLLYDITIIIILLILLKSLLIDQLFIVLTNYNFHVDLVILDFLIRNTIHLQKRIENEAKKTQISTIPSPIFLYFYFI
jgi:hypothetical protein